MVVEHEYICTLAPTEFEKVATELLVSLGFSREPASAAKCVSCSYSLQGLTSTTCPECGAVNLAAMHVPYARGDKPKSFQYEFITRHPQRVLAQLDRGKVTVAASIEEYRSGVERETYQELMTALCTTLERATGPTLEGTHAARGFLEVEQRVMELCKRRRRWKWTAAGIVVALFIFSCFGLVMCSK